MRAGRQAASQPASQAASQPGSQVDRHTDGQMNRHHPRFCPKAIYSVVRTCKRAQPHPATAPPPRHPPQPASGHRCSTAWMVTSGKDDARTHRPEFERVVRLERALRRQRDAQRRGSHLRSVGATPQLLGVGVVLKRARVHDASLSLDLRVTDRITTHTHPQRGPGRRTRQPASQRASEPLSYSSGSGHAPPLQNTGAATCVACSRSFSATTLRA
jgi:hypothetical protein